MSSKIKYRPLTDKIIKAFYSVYNELGSEFLESVYEKYLLISLRNFGLKAVEHILRIHETQIINYLKATKIEIGLLLNFGTKPEFKISVYSNSNK